MSCVIVEKKFSGGLVPPATRASLVRIGMFFFVLLKTAIVGMFTTVQSSIISDDFTVEHGTLWPDTSFSVFSMTSIFGHRPCPCMLPWQCCVYAFCVHLLSTIPKIYRFPYKILIVFKAAHISVKY